MREAFSKTVDIGSIVVDRRARRVGVTVRWDGKRLAITGTVYPEEAFGQIQDLLPSVKPNRGVTRTEIDRLKEVWDRWHLNDMRAGCEHQRATFDLTEEVELVTYRLTSEGLREKQRRKDAAWEALLRGETVTIPEMDRAVLSLPYTCHSAPDADGPGAGMYEVAKRETKAVGWVSASEHPKGLLGKPCEVCGYRYGSAWLHEDVPDDVIEFLRAFAEGAE